MPIDVETSQESPRVSVITIDRPDRRNALDRETLADLRAAVSGVGTDGTRAVVLTGAGSNFCAGADLSTVEDDGFVEELRGLLEDLQMLEAPVIAAIHGPALGAGTQLAMACDLRLAARGATFGIPAAKLGLTVDYFTVHHLALALGHSVARAMLVGAEVFDADRLAGTGFVHRLVEDGADVRAEGTAWAADIARLAPLTIAAHKAMLASAEQTGEPAAAAVAARTAAWQSEDLTEGLAAFGERRRPSFQGR